MASGDMSVNDFIKGNDAFANALKQYYPSGTVPASDVQKVYTAIQSGAFQGVLGSSVQPSGGNTYTYPGQAQGGGSTQGTVSAGAQNALNALGPQKAAASTGGGGGGGGSPYGLNALGALGAAAFSAAGLGQYGGYLVSNPTPSGDTSSMSQGGVQSVGSPSVGQFVPGQATTAANLAAGASTKQFNNWFNANQGKTVYVNGQMRTIGTDISSKGLNSAYQSGGLNFATQNQVPQSGATGGIFGKAATPQPTSTTASFTPTTPANAAGSVAQIGPSGAFATPGASPEGANPQIQSNQMYQPGMPPGAPGMAQVLNPSRIGLSTSAAPGLNGRPGGYTAGTGATTPSAGGMALAQAGGIPTQRLARGGQVKKQPAQQQQQQYKMMPGAFTQAAPTPQVTPTQNFTPFTPYNAAGQNAATPFAMPGGMQPPPNIQPGQALPVPPGQAGYNPAAFNSWMGQQGIQMPQNIPQGGMPPGSAPAVSQGYGQPPPGMPAQYRLPTTPPTIQPGQALAVPPGQPGYNPAAFNAQMAQQGIRMPPGMTGAGAGLAGIAGAGPAPGMPNMSQFMPQVPIQNVSQAQERQGTMYAAKGGQVPGSTDTVPAMLTPGEYVINRNAVSRIGVGNLNRMNQQPQSFADGGQVSSPSQVEPTYQGAYSPIGGYGPQGPAPNQGGGRGTATTGMATSGVASTGAATTAQSASFGSPEWAQWVAQTSDWMAKYGNTDYGKQYRQSLRGDPFGDQMPEYYGKGQPLPQAPTNRNDYISQLSDWMARYGNTSLGKQYRKGLPDLLQGNQGQVQGYADGGQVSSSGDTRERPSQQLQVPGSQGSSGTPPPPQPNSGYGPTQATPPGTQPAQTGQYGGGMGMFGSPMMMQAMAARSGGATGGGYNIPGGGGYIGGSPGAGMSGYMYPNQAAATAAGDVGMGPGGGPSAAMGAASAVGGIASGISQAVNTWANSIKPWRMEQSAIPNPSSYQRYPLEPEFSPDTYT